MVVGASRDDIDVLQDIQNRTLTQDEINRYKHLINYAWHVDSAHIKHVDYAHLHEVTNVLCEKYRGGTLLIKEAAYEKILRIAAALAVLSGSVEKDKLVITNELLDWSKDYLSYLFARPSIDYEYYVTKIQEEEKLTKQNTEWAIAQCTKYPALVVLLNNTKFRGTQMSEVLGLDRDAVSKLLAEMLVRGLIKMTTGGLYTPSANLINIVRKFNGGKYE